MLLLTQNVSEDNKGKYTIALSALSDDLTLTAVTHKPSLSS